MTGQRFFDNLPESFLWCRIIYPIPRHSELVSRIYHNHRLSTLHWSKRNVRSRKNKYKIQSRCRHLYGSSQTDATDYQWIFHSKWQVVGIQCIWSHVCGSTELRARGFESLRAIISFWPQRLYLWYHPLISPNARMAIDQIYQPLVSVTTWFYNHSYNHGTILVFTHYLSFFQYLIWS